MTSYLRSRSETENQSLTSGYLPNTITKYLYTALLALLFFIPAKGWGQVSITSTATPFTQNFDGLANSGTSSTLPLGWAFNETGSNANTTYTADDGTANGGNTFSFGTTSATDRALGMLRSGNLISTIGASFINNSGTVISSLQISYTGEMWRLGTSNTSADRLDFQYSTNAISLTIGTWVDVDQLDFTSPITSGTVGKLNGNSTANRTLISYEITGLTINPGETFYIRWNDFDVISADDGLAVDDFSITAIASAADTTPPTLSTLSPLDNATNVAINTNLSLTFNENVKAGTGNLYIKKVSDGSTVQTIDIANTAAVSFSGATATINPPNDLANNTDYYIEVENGAITDIAGNAFAGISGNSTWNFKTALPTYTLTVTQPTGGSITPGTTNVNEGANQIFTYNTNSCYTFNNWIIDGANAGPGNTYSFTNVTGNHTIAVSETLKTNTITASAGANGSISPTVLLR